MASIEAKKNGSGTPSRWFLANRYGLIVTANGYIGIAFFISKGILPRFSIRLMMKHLGLEFTRQSLDFCALRYA